MNRLLRKKDKSFMRNKVTMGQFFAVQWKIINELYTAHKAQTVALVLISCLTLFSNLINLKFLEYTTNKMSVLVQEQIGTQDFQIFYVIGVFLLALLVMQLFQNIYNKIRLKYISDISTEVEKNHF